MGNGLPRITNSTSLVSYTSIMSSVILEANPPYRALYRYRPRTGRQLCPRGLPNSHQERRCCPDKVFRQHNWRQPRCLVEEVVRPRSRQPRGLYVTSNAHCGPRLTQTTSGQYSVSRERKDLLRGSGRGSVLCQLHLMVR